MRGQLTTGFLRRCDDLKDNRIRPRGFDPAFYAANPSPYISKLAECHGAVCDDPYYQDPQLTGADLISYRIDLPGQTLDQVDRLTVRLLNQSIPPPFLRERFRDAGIGPANGDDIGRLFYLTNHLNTGNREPDGGPGFIRDWKLEVARDCRLADGGPCP